MDFSLFGPLGALYDYLDFPLTASSCTSKISSGTSKF